MISKKKALQMIDVIADMFPNAECELNYNADKKIFEKDDVVVICLSGRGDKDMETYLKNLVVD